MSKVGGDGSGVFRPNSSQVSGLQTSKINPLKPATAAKKSNAEHSSFVGDISSTITNRSMPMPSGLTGLPRQTHFPNT